jgi:hypothetical protein
LVRRWRWHSRPCSPALAGAALGVAIKDATVSIGAKICEHFDCQTVLATYI